MATDRSSPNRIVPMFALSLAYKVCVITSGMGCIYMGYSLFCLGINGEAGDLSANGGGFGLTIQSAAPGTFFALFGAILIGITVWRGMEADQQWRRYGSNSESTELRSSDRVPESLPESRKRLQSLRNISENERGLDGDWNELLAELLGSSEEDPKTTPPPSASPLEEDNRPKDLIHVCKCDEFAETGSTLIRLAA